METLPRCSLACEMDNEECSSIMALETVEIHELYERWQKEAISRLNPVCESMIPRSLRHRNLRMVLWDNNYINNKTLFTVSIRFHTVKLYMVAGDSSKVSYAD